MAARLAAPPAPPSPEGLLDLGLDLVGHIARQLPQTYRWVGGCWSAPLAARVRSRRRRTAAAFLPQRPRHWG